MTDDQDPLQARLGLLVPINNLDRSQQDQVLNSAQTLDIKKKDYIFRQGDRDNFSFYVLSGEVEMFADDQLIKRVVGGEGASFHALAQLQPRQMSARAKTKLEVLKVDRGLLDRLLSVDGPISGALPDIEVAELDASDGGDWLTEMLQSELFARVPPSNIQRLLETLETVEFKAGEDVIVQGAPGDFYYAVQSGRCEVLRTMKNNKPIKLAELGPGERFGEEALVSNAKRNATVRMLSDGELARLTKDDFVELIKKPVMRTASLDEARTLVADGAAWLDVRFPEEHQANGFDGCLNIPLSNLRSAQQNLARDVHYIVYCDTGGRSSAAAFLLTQEGFEVSYIEGGAIDEVPAQTSKNKPVAKKPPSAPAASEPAPVKASQPTPQDEVVAADVRAQSLTADLEKAKIQIAQAERIMAEANAAKQEADRLIEEKLSVERAKVEREAAAVAERLAAADKTVADKLGAERKKIEDESAALAQRARQVEQAAEEKIRAERAQLDAQASLVAQRLEEAQGLKNEIERQQQGAEEEAKRRHLAQEESAEAMRLEAEERLREEENRIEELYREQAEKLENLEQEREQTKHELETAWGELNSEASLSKERLEAAKKLEAELLEKEQLRERELADREAKMRAAMQAELEAERKKLEAQFATTQDQIERARRDKEAAATAKAAAAEEAQRIITEYKSAQEKLHAEQQAKILAERKKLEEDAAQLSAQLAAAASAREQAQAMKREAEAQLSEARDRHQSVDETEASLRAEVEAIEARARAATERLRTAVAQETSAAKDIRDSEERLERTYGTAKEMNILLHNELDEWVAEQERLQAATAGRREIAKQLEQTERIKVRAVQAQNENQRHDTNLLDEIAAQLGEN